MSRRVTHHESSGIEFSTAADLARIVTRTEFCARDWLARGVVTMIISTPGLGKTYVGLDVVKRLLSSDAAWFDGEPISARSDGRVIWCDTEAGQAILSDRIQKLDIPQERFLLPFPDPLQEVRLDDDTDMVQLENLVQTVQPVLLIVDSLRGSHKQEENDSRMQTILHRLARIAEIHNIPVLVIHHTNKPAPGELDLIDSINRSRGSSAIAAQCRTVWALDKPDPTSSWLRLHIIKNNLGRTGCAIGVRVTELVEWRNRPPQQPRRPSKEEEAMDFLRQALKDGPRPMQDVEEEALLDGIARMTLRRASKRVGVERSRPDKDHNYWVWSLPVQYIDLRPSAAYHVE